MSTPATRGTLIHISQPIPVDRSLSRQACPTCKKKRWFVGWFYEWYGWDHTCLSCGDRWSDGEMCERPFMRGWRKKSIDSAKARWRREAARKDTK